MILSLVNLDFNPCHMEFAAQTPFNFLIGRILEKQRKSFSQVMARISYCGTLARDINFWTHGHITIAFVLDNGGQASLHSLTPVACLAQHPVTRFYSCVL